LSAPCVFCGRNFGPLATLINIRLSIDAKPASEF
jgi:hypothetical protein